MRATVAFILGIILGIIVLLATRDKRPLGGSEPAVNDGPLKWVVLAFGAFASTTLVGATLYRFIAKLFDVRFGLILSELNLYNLSIAFAFATVIAGIGGLLRGERRWPMWVGTILAIIPAIVWLVFAVGEFIYPH